MSKAASPPLQSVIRIALALARALHRYGATTHRLESDLVSLCGALGVRCEVFASPTSVMCSFAAGEDEQVRILRTEPGGYELGRITLLEDVARHVAAGVLTPEEGVARVEEISRAPRIYPPAVMVACYCAASATAAGFLGGGIHESVVAAGIGLVTGLLAALRNRWSMPSGVFELLAAMVAGFAAWIALPWLGAGSRVITTAAGLIVLFPGFTVTLAMTEIATGHLAAGTARFGASFATFTMIGFGVAMGTRLGGLVAPAALGPLIALPPGFILIALPVAALAVTLLFEPRPGDIPWGVLGGLLAYAAAAGGAALLGPQLGAFGGALALGMASNAFSRARQRPVALMQVPGILLLVPGSVGFRSVAAMLEANVVSGVETAFAMVMVTAALVAGLLLASVLLPPRRTL